MGFYLAFQEVFRNRSRFFLFSLVIALITVLVLFTAALAEGLALANKQYLEKLDAQLLVFQKNVDLSPATSRIGRSQLNDLMRVEGVQAVGSIGFSSASIVSPNGETALNISLIGVEADQPGAPRVLEGKNLIIDRGLEVVIDDNVVDRLGVRLGDTIRIKTIQGTQEQFYNLKVVGITDGQQYLFQPSVFVPYRSWDQIRPQAGNSSGLVELTSNVVAIRLTPGTDLETGATRIREAVKNVDVVDIPTAWQALPGYSVQQSTLNTMQVFTLLIGVLVIGGFFQIQMLQKIPLIGVLKAIGASNGAVASAVVAQIIMVTTFGVALGGSVALLLASFMPPSVPIMFAGNSILIAVIALLLIGPIGGLVSVRLAVRVEPLIALGLSS